MNRLKTEELQLISLQHKEIKKEYNLQYLTFRLPNILKKLPSSTPSIHSVNHSFEEASARLRETVFLTLISDQSIIPIM